MKANSPKSNLLTGIIILSVLAFTSCTKKANPTIHSFSADAVVLNKGDIAADGCGWQIKVSDSLYSPVSIASQFQVDNLKVHIAFHKLTTRFYCSQIANDPGPGITQIQIDTIRTE